MAKHRCYIADRNPFGLPSPPAWWLNGLQAFDPDLVVLPSRTRPVHLLARRRTLTAQWVPQIAIDLNTDSALLRQHRLVSVTWFASTEGFTDGLLLYLCHELAARDTWAVNGLPATMDDIKKSMFEGGSTFTRAVEAREQAEQAQLNRSIRDDLWHATGEAWRLKQYLTGETSRPFKSARPVADSSSSSTPDATPTGTVARDARSVV